LGSGIEAVMYKAFDKKEYLAHGAACVAGVSLKLTSVIKYAFPMGVKNRNNDII